MKFNDQLEDAWVACPPGEIRQLAIRLRRGRRRRIAGRVAAALAVMVAIGVGGRWAFLGRAANDYLHGGLYCSQVRPVLSDYRAGKLSPEHELQVKAHLAECPPCRKWLAEHASRLPDDRDGLGGNRFVVINRDGIPNCLCGDVAHRHELLR